MIYLDHAATTPIDKTVVKAMEPFYCKNFGNPSSIYKLGREAKQYINDARQKIASYLHSSPEEIIFTAGGTESDNLAIFGAVHPFLSNPNKYHLVTSSIEHPAILKAFKQLEQAGFKVTYLSVNKYGIVDPKDLINSLKPNTILVSIMYANNEIGTIQPIKKIAGIIKNYRHIQRVDTISKDPIYPIFHTDACQAAGYLDLNIDNLGIDMMTLNGSKIYGPKQTGILYKKNSIKLSPIIFGGEQEQGLRPGTENTAGIAGFTKAIELVEKDKAKESNRLSKLRDYFIIELLKIDNTILNGHPAKRLPNNINVSFLGIEGESLLLKLDQDDIYLSTGSACHSTSLEPSHVILSLGLAPEYAHSSVRFTMGKSTTKPDIDKTIRAVKKAVRELRRMSAIKTK